MANRGCIGALLSTEAASQELASLGRIEISQATGMLTEQLGVDTAEALARLRGHAFAEGRTASAVAWDCVEMADVGRAEGGR